MRSGLALIALGVAAPVSAQLPSPPDTARQPSLTPVVVTAERTRTSIASSVSAVTRIAGEEIARIPRVTLADVLRMAPGFTVIDFDGLGFDPQVMARGFYGGGEAEYVVVLVDGKPVNQLQTGLVAWDVLPPLASVEAIEVVRGSASPLYGDAAVGGVINVITRPAAEVGARLMATHGGHDTRRTSFDVSGLWRRFAIGAARDETEGFRARSTRDANRIRMGLNLIDGAATRVGLTARSYWRSFDEPGPLLESLLAANRDAFDLLFRYDHTKDQSHTLMLDGSQRLGGTATLTAAIGGELRTTDAIRTLALAPGFGDTKQREADNRRAVGSVQLEVADSPLPGGDLVILGAELSHGTVESKYFPVFTGTREDYENLPRDDRILIAQGEAARRTVGVFGQYTVFPWEPLRLSIGARYDHLGDRFEPQGPSTGEHIEGSHSAFSPRVGINFRYLRREQSTGHVFASASRSFKAPTLDQLYDQRSIPVPFPPFAITTSSPDLDPQFGTNIEAGIYHDIPLPRSLRGGLSLSAYQMDMKDELDFDVENFRYVNIGRSRHRGLEAGASVSGNWASLFTSYTLQHAESRSGDDAGKRLKAIPLHTLNAGISARSTRGPEAALLVIHSRDVWLDDANTVELPDITRLDVRLGWAFTGLTVFADVRNVLDRQYSSSGFLDPSGTGEPYFYPAAERFLEVGLRSRW